MPMTPKQMIQYLKKHGFIVISQNRSHVKMQHPLTKQQTIIPVHSHDLKKGIETAILKQSGLK